MQLYAFIDKDNIVVQVIEGRTVGEVIDGISDWEAHYTESFGLPCKRVDMLNTDNYPSIGYTYDQINDAFVPPMPDCGHDSLILNHLKRWECANCDEIAKRMDSIQDQG